MWPFLDKGICGIIKSTTKPIFHQYIGKFAIGSIEFDRLTLGSLPPTIQGVKVYTTRERDLVIEPAVRWAGNPNITIGLKVLSLRMTVQLLDLQIFMLPRITLKPFVPTFPCFANICVSLMDKPHVDFGLKLLGGDIMAIPGLYQYIQEIVKDQVISLYHWPSVLEIPILDGSRAMRKPVGILHVTVVRALNLSKMDVFGKSDPYVMLSLSEEKLMAKKTTIKMKNLNPEWNEQFRLVVKDPETQSLQLQVYDWEKVGTHDKLGMQVVPLSLLTPREMKAFTLDLLKNTNPNDPQNKINRGKIVVEMTFVPFKDDNDMLICSNPDGDVSEDKGTEKGAKNMTSTGGLLLVAVQGAEDVEGKRHNNPYALILFRGEEKKTKIIKKSRDPTWDEEFQFILEEAPVDQKIHIEVMSKGRVFMFRLKESLGHVDINLTDVVNNGRINEKYHLINSKNGVINVEIRWKYF